MTQEEFDALKVEVNAGVDSVASLAATFAPEFIPYIMLGRVIAKAIPVLYEDAYKLVHKQDPTPEEKADFAFKIKALASPETI